MRFENGNVYKNINENKYWIVEEKQIIMLNAWAHLINTHEREKLDEMVLQGHEFTEVAMGDYKVILQEIVDEMGLNKYLK